MAVNMILNGLLFLLLGLGASPPPEGMSLMEDAAREILTVREDDKAVLTYRFGDQLADGADPIQTRSCYIHPVYGPDGSVLTDDFPGDHPHHHGMFWTWPVVRTRGRRTQTWHPAEPSLRQHFARWLERRVHEGTARLRIENHWKLEGREVVAREVVSIFVFPEIPDGRIIDFELRLEAVGGPLEISGSPDQSKGYGGLCWRAAPPFKGAVMTTDLGKLKQDVTDTPFKWADLSTGGSGVAIFVAPDHPGYPIPWLIRNSYAGVLNPSWPGLETAALRPGEPAVLRYRIFIHHGDAERGRVKEAYRAWTAQNADAEGIVSGRSGISEANTDQDRR